MVRYIENNIKENTIVLRKSINNEVRAKGDLALQLTNGISVLLEDSQERYKDKLDYEQFTDDLVRYYLTEEAQKNGFFEIALITIDGWLKVGEILDNGNIDNNYRSEKSRLLYILSSE